MQISFGTYSNHEDRGPMRWIIKRTAAECGVSEALTVLMMSTFLEEIAMTVAMGDAISPLPRSYGQGMVCLYSRKRSHRRNHQQQADAN